jgi:hypothetical protein
MSDEQAQERSLTREEVEVILEGLGMWKNGKQTSDLTQREVELLLRKNTEQLRRDRISGQGLPLHGLKFAKKTSFANLDLTFADFRGERFHLGILVGQHC